jgi:glutathione S-transferase
MPPSEKPILFHYPASIYSHRILWYLWLRRIPFDQCIQPPVMPRPDLASIGVGYRKIPIISIGKDVYCDSRLILSKLEALYPDSALAVSRPSDAGVRALFESWTVDGGIFANAVRLMPYWVADGMLQDKAFLDDRQKLSGGRRMTKEAMEAGRPDGLQNIRQAFEMLEKTFLADGRDWVLATKEPSVADIDAVWPFEWIVVDRFMRQGLLEVGFGEQKYPRVYAWVKRFMSVVEERKKACEKPTTLDGATMAMQVLSASSQTDDIGFISDDPLDLKKGDQVEVYPADYGQMGKSLGALVGLSTSEVVIKNDKGLHLHFPRWNFSIKKLVTSTPTIPANPKTTIPKMRLIYHPVSPFSRKVYFLAHELNLAKHITLQKVVVCPVPFPGWSDNNADVSAHNPMTKIPCLISDDVPDGIYDSNVICEYLEHIASATRTKDTRYWQLHTLHACANGIMDAAVLITYELRIRKAKGILLEEWLEGQKQKIVRGLDRLEDAVKGGVLPDPSAEPASADEVAIAVATAMTGQMGYLGIDWKDGRPKLEAWVKKWEGRQSFVESSPTREWGVEEKKNGGSKI